MMADAARRKFDVVLFWALDRFSREGVYETHTYLKWLDDSGVRFRSFPEPYLDSCGMFRDAVISICGDRKARTFATPRASASRVETRAPDWHQIRQTNRTSESGLPP
jgi:DNA invertase Pin-like site-specific DNA recombinase